MIKNFLKRDMIYFIKSKTFFCFTFILTLFFVLAVFCNYLSALDYYKNYKRVYAEYEEEGIDIQAAMQDGYDLESENDGQLTVTSVRNALPYYYEETYDSMISIAPQNLLGTIYAALPAFAVVFVVILGVILTNEDIRHKTVKLYVTRYAKSPYILLKYLSTIIRAVIMLFASTIAAFIISVPMYYIVQKKVTDIVIIPQQVQGQLICKQILLAIGIFLLYVSLGTLLAVITRNNTLSIILAVLYTFIPFHFNYDTGAIINAFASEVYNYNGNFASINYTVNVNAISVLLVFLVPITAVIMSVIIFNKRSSYV